MNYLAVSLNYVPFGLNSEEAVSLSFVEELDVVLMVDNDD